MAIFNLTNLDTNDNLEDFRISNMNIQISNVELRVSELQITEQEWLGNY